MAEIKVRIEDLGIAVNTPSDLNAELTKAFAEATRLPNTLEQLPDVAIVAFASHWGPLGICRHLVPWMHSLTGRSMTSLEPPCRPLWLSEKRTPEVEEAPGVIGGWEPLAKWRQYSEQADSIAYDAIKLKNSRRDRRALEEVAKLHGRIRGWLQETGVMLWAYTEPDHGEASWPHGLTLTFEIVGVFQIVALQLFALVAGGRGLAQCSHCGAPFALTI